MKNLKKANNAQGLALSSLTNFFPMFPFYTPDNVRKPYIPSKN